MFTFVAEVEEEGEANGHLAIEGLSRFCATPLLMSVVVLI